MPSTPEAALRAVERRLVDPDGGEASLVARMAHYRIPGAALALIADGELAVERAYGLKEASRPDRVTTTTRFQACSISKPVAVLGMLRLAERGQLDLDTDVNLLLRSWRVPPNSSWHPRVTLRQIASHTAGLTVGGFPGYGQGARLPTLTQILTGAFPANTAGIRVDTVPGVEFRYAGGGTTVLQQVLEDVTGRSFADLLHELVLEPLGMSRSGYLQPLPKELHEEVAVAHRSDGASVEGGWHVYPELAAAGLWTTPGDLARYAIAVQRAAAGAPEAVLGPELTTSMLTPHVPASSRLGGLDSLGLGLFLGGRDTVWFGHSGGNEGFRCHLLAHRDAGCGLVVMTNGDRGHSLVAEILDGVAREMEWPDYEAAGLEDLADAPLGIDELVGVYELRPDARIAVERHGDDLLVTVAAQAPIRFLRVSESEFASFAVETTLAFEAAGAGGAGELAVRQNGGELRCRRVV
jgi:CubicO group peptidase (beta-lactamase class C family)